MTASVMVVSSSFAKRLASASASGFRMLSLMCSSMRVAVLRHTQSCGNDCRR